MSEQRAEAGPAASKKSPKKMGKGMSVCVSEGGCGSVRMTDSRKKKKGSGMWNESF